MILCNRILESLIIASLKKIPLFILVVAINTSYGRFQRLGACFLAPDTWYDCHDIHTVDTFAYLASEDLVIINIAKPDSPFIVARLDTTNILRKAIEPRYPYAFAVGSGYVGSFDITDPSMPLFLDSIGLPVNNDLEIKDGYAYASGDFLYLVDVNTPNSLNYMGIIDSIAPAGRLVRNEDYLYELNGSCSLFIYDINNASNPQKIGTCPLPIAFTLTNSEPQYRDSLIFYSRTVPGIHQLTLNTVDVSNPYNPSYTTASSSVGTDINNTYDLALSGDFAYVTFNVNSNTYLPSICQGEEPLVSVFDITNPNNLVPVYHNQDYAWIRAIGIDALADTIYLCDGDSFYIYLDTLWTGITELNNTLIPRYELNCFPNPCYDYTWLTPANNNTTLNNLQTVSLYDISGRLVFEFTPAITSLDTDIFIDLTMRGGKNISDGIYFVQCRYKNQSTCITKLIKL